MGDKVQIPSNKTNLWQVSAHKQLPSPALLPAVLQEDAAPRPRRGCSLRASRGKGEERGRPRREAGAGSGQKRRPGEGGESGVRAAPHPPALASSWI